MDAIDRIHEYLRFGTVLGLDRMKDLIDRLGNPQDDLDVIHVAGTNGKGSVCRYIYEVLRAGGYRAGIYSSPYLEVFNERIEFDGEYITDKELEDITDKVCAAADNMVSEGKESPTEFEIVTAIAFLFFKEKGADYVVLEVGLGGRGDSTNIVKEPLCSVITSISLDHTDRLGETVPEIAYEKAGIIKKNCPVVVGSKDAEAKAVLRKTATDMGAAFFDATRAIPKIVKSDMNGLAFSAEVLDKEYKGINISMAGDYQADNAVTALYAIELLRRQDKVDITSKEIRQGMKNAKNIGRMEVLSEEPWVIIDGAHNPDGAKSLKNNILKNFGEKKILMVLGILADKEVDEVLDTFKSITSDYIATEPANPRALAASELSSKIVAAGGNSVTAESPSDAVKIAMDKRDEYDVILFAGSLYLIGSIRREIINSI
ncbi:MAG: folylpolyglutamate synthase/dihydrofolate synthase family protein [Hornefia sp.]|nr:folylpolyglutamate synthase/dihydrofolate synthase family protein [Hornefia sp.]